MDLLEPHQSATGEQACAGGTGAQVVVPSAQDSLAEHGSDEWIESVAQSMSNTSARPPGLQAPVKLTEAGHQSDTYSCTCTDTTASKSLSSTGSAAASASLSLPVGGQVSATQRRARERQHGRAAVNAHQTTDDPTLLQQLCAV